VMTGNNPSARGSQQQHPGCQRYRKYSFHIASGVVSLQLS
ncbi:hypothetical protein TNCT_278351, partial [Trichonephila clavata]